MGEWRSRRALFDSGLCAAVVGGVFALASLAGCGGGAARYALMRDLDENLDTLYGQDARLNAFYCTVSSKGEPCIPDREDTRVFWTVICGGPGDEACSPTLRKYQDIFDAAARITATVIQVRFVLQGLERGDYALGDIPPLVSFAISALPGVMQEGEAIVARISTLDPAGDLSSSPFLAPRIIGALPETVATLGSALAEVGEIISLLAGLGIDVPDKPPTGTPANPAKSSSGTGPAANGLAVGRADASSTNSDDVQAKPVVILPSAPLVHVSDAGFTPNVVSAWEELAPGVTLLSVRDGSDATVVMAELRRALPKADVRRSASRLLVRLEGESHLLEAMVRVSVLEPAVQDAVRAVLETCSTRGDPGACEESNLSEAVRASCAPEECRSRAAARVGALVSDAAESCTRDAGDLACYALGMRSLGLPTQTTARLQAECLASCRARTEATKEQLWRTLDALSAGVTERCIEERRLAVCDQLASDLQHLETLRESTGLSLGRLGALGVEKEKFRALRLQCQSECRRRMTGGRR